MPSSMELQLQGGGVDGVFSMFSLSEQWQTLETAFSSVNASLERTHAELCVKMREFKAEMETRENAVNLKEERRRIAVVEAKETVDKRREMGEKFREKLKEKLNEEYCKIQVGEGETVEKAVVDEKDIGLKKRRVSEQVTELERREVEVSERLREVELKEKKLSEALMSREKEIEEKGLRIEAKEKEFDRRCREYELRKKEIEEKGLGVEAKEKEFEAKELTESVMLFRLKERQHRVDSEGLMSREKEIEEKRLAFEVKEKEFDKRCHEYESRKKEIEEKGLTLEVKEKELSESRKTLELKEKQSRELLEALKLRQKEIEEKGLVPGVKEKELCKEKLHEEYLCVEKELRKVVEETEEEVVRRFKVVEAKERQLNERSQALDLKEKLVAEHYCKVKESRQQKSDERCHEMDMETRQVSEQVTELERREREVSERFKEVKLREKEIEEKGSAIEVKEKEFDRRCCEYELRQKEIEEKGLTFEVKEKEFDKLVMELIKNQKALELKEKHNHDLSEALKLRQKEIEEKGLALEVKQEFCKLYQEQESREKELTEVPMVPMVETERLGGDLIAYDGETLQLLLNDKVDEHCSMGETILKTLKSYHDPPSLVLSALNGFFPPHLKKGNVVYPTRTVRSSCVLLLEQFMKVGSEICEDARVKAEEMARLWRQKMQETGESRVVVLGFLLLVVTFRLTPQFEKDELKRLWKIVDQHALGYLCPKLRLELGLFEESEGRADKRMACCCDNELGSHGALKRCSRSPTSEVPYQLKRVKHEVLESPVQPNMSKIPSTESSFSSGSPQAISPRQLPAEREALPATNATSTPGAVSSVATPPSGEDQRQTENKKQKQSVQRFPYGYQYPGFPEHGYFPGGN